MTESPFAAGDSLVHRLDPRPRIVIALLFAALAAVSRRPEVPWAALGAALLVAALARLPSLALLRRLAALNLFVLFLWLFLPFAQPGEPLGRIGPLVATRPGVRYALAITLKANAIVLGVSALVSTIDLTRLGHALAHLRVPAKLIHLFLFTVRYLDLLHREHRRLLNALKARAFRPRTDRHTYRTLGYLLGMLLLNSFDRANRVLAAMKCRGWRGRFYLMHHFALAPRDFVFLAASGAALALLGWMEWTPMLR